VAGGVRFVKEGERGIMLRFEKALKRNGEYRVILPGLRLMGRECTRSRVSTFANERSTSPSRRSCSVSGRCSASVRSLCVGSNADRSVQALFETTGIDEALTDYGLLIVREVLAGKSYAKTCL
jgi:hypothetical protein